MQEEQSPGHSRYLNWVLAGLVLGVGLAVTALFAPQSRMPVEALAEEVSRAHHDRLLRALVEQTTDTLLAASSLTTADDQALPPEAVRFLSRFPLVTGLEQLITVSHAQRPMVERRLSEQSGQFIQFGQWSSPRQTLPAATAQQYLVVTRSWYRDSSSLAAASLGLVATSVPHWGSALETALNEQRAAATTLTDLNHNGAELAALRVFIPVKPATGNAPQQLLALVIRPRLWLSGLLEPLHDGRWQTEIHDISQHARQPLAHLDAAGELLGSDSAIRSTFTFADRQWMLSTLPSRSWQDALSQQATWPAWVAGLAVTLLATTVVAWGGWRLTRLNALLAKRTRRARKLGQQLDNTRLEKNILHHSLQESDRRTRDVISLGGGIFAELDESRHIGYISPQVADLLGMPSADLINHTLDSLIPPEHRGELSMAFDAARREPDIQRLDTELQTGNDERLPMAIRIVALKDPLSGCAGFRVSMTPRQ